MLKDVQSLQLQGASFEIPTRLPLFREDNKRAKAVLLYGRNGSGKSTIARAFRRLKGIAAENIQTAFVLDEHDNHVVLSDEDKAHIFVFDEAFVNENVRVQEDGLGSIVMLGEQAGLTELIMAAAEDLKCAETERDHKKTVLDEYTDSSCSKSPRYYINKMYAVLQQDNGWAGRKRKIEGLRRNASVTDDTYKIFLSLSPERTRDELIVDFEQEWKHLEVAKSGASKISTPVPTVPSTYSEYKSDTASTLIKRLVEHPELNERELYLLGLVQTGHGEELKQTAKEFASQEIKVCPKCHQSLTSQYKADLIKSIQTVLSEEVKKQQNLLRELILPELIIDLASFQCLKSYQTCINQIDDLNSALQRNNALIQTKIDDPYTPVHETLTPVLDRISSLKVSLEQLEDERRTYNHTVDDISPIKATLTRINNEIAHWDVLEYSKQYDAAKIEKANAERQYLSAVDMCSEKQNRLNELNAQRDSIDIAIGVINDGLKYIFFSDDRMKISVDDKQYRLTCNGHPVKPKDVSVGERNIIGLCYFFTSILKGKSCEDGYSEEYLLIIDDPVSSYDLENRVGILSYLKYEMGKFLLGNAESRALVMTHDLFTAVDVGKICTELMADCNKKYSDQSKFVYSQKELRSNNITRFINKRNEYTALLEIVFDYAKGGASDQEPYIGNIIRQVLEAFSTFEFKKKIDDVSVDDEILALISCEKHRQYFKNLMYRIVLNEGSHRYDQTRNMQVDFFSFIAEPDKRRTAREVLCFMELLNAPHIKAHLGVGATNTIDGWCKSICSDT